MTTVSEVLADSPLVFWQLDDAPGGVAVDSSGNGRDAYINGTLTFGATGIAPDSARCFDFTGTAEVRIPSATWMNVTSFTSEAWFVADDITGDRVIMSRTDWASSPPDAARGWHMILSSGRFHVALRFTDGTYFHDVVGPAPTVGTLYYTALRWDGTTASLYVNGSVVWSTTAYAGKTLNNPTKYLMLSGQEYGALGHFDGRIDQAAFYDTALSTARLSAHYTGTGTASPITVSGTPWSVAAAWLDGAPVGITVSGDAWAASAEWLNGNVSLGGAPVGITVSGDAWTVPAVWLATSGVNESSLTFESDGYDYTGASTVTWEPAAATPPMGAFPTATPPNRVHHAIGAPTFDNGRPLFTFGSETITPWVDYLRVTVGGKDVTWFRDVQTIIGGWQNLDPYGDASASLSFPQVSEFEAFGTGELSWLRKTAPVVINRVVDGTVVDSDAPLFDGFIARDPIDSGPAQVSVEGKFMGRMSRLMHQPNPLHDPQADAGWHVYRTFGTPPAQFPLNPRGGPHTGINIRSRGDRSMTRLGYLDHILGLAIEESGDSWTILPDRSLSRNTMAMRKRTMATVHATVCAGAHGVKVRDFASDIAENRLYGEGQSPEGGRWRNLMYPNAGYDDDAPDYPFTSGASFGIGTTDADTDTGAGISVLTRRLWGLGLLDASGAPPVIGPVFDADVQEAVNDFRRRLGLAQNGMVTSSLWANLYKQGFNKQSIKGAYFEPVAADAKTVEFLTGPGGMVVGRNPNHDRTVQWAEGFRAYGENVRKLEAKRHARAEIARTEVRTGTIVLTSDPAEMHRWELRAGMTLLVKNLMGTGEAGLKLYISSVEVNPNGSGEVTLAVATSALHFIELATIRQRQVEARQNPAKRARQMFRRSAQVADSVIGWESEGPSGVVPRRRVQAGQWNALQVVAAERGTLAEMRFVTDDPTRFMVMVFGQRVPERLLNRKIGDPFDWRGTGDDKQNTFQAHAEWLQRHLMSQAYGDPDEPGGYWPRHHTNEAGKVTTHPVTGILKDDASQPFVTTACFLWVYVWPKADAWFHGRLKLVPED